MIKQGHNSLAIHGNLWTLKFDNFSDCWNLISDSLVTLIINMKHSYFIQPKQQVGIKYKPYEFHCHEKYGTWEQKKKTMRLW